MAVVMMMTVIFAPEAAGVGRGVVERPGASQPRRQVEVTEVEWPRDLGREGGGGRGREVGGAHALEQASAGAGRGALGLLAPGVNIAMK